MRGGSSELRVGVFVTAALVVGSVLIFVIGNGSTMFMPRVHYHAYFDSAEGLRTGSPVRIAGIDVGTVREVVFQDDGRVRVDMGVRRDDAPYIRETSTATIGSKGLLGDKLIDITSGTGDQLDPSQPIPVSEASMLTAFLGDTGRDAEGIVRNLNRTTEGLADPAFQEDLRGFVHNLRTLTSMAAEEDGTFRRLLVDSDLADEVSATLRNLRATSSELASTTRGVRQVVTEVRSGDGTAHELIYGQQGIELLVGITSVAIEAATILRDVRTGDNNAHTLLYGDDAGRLVENLTAVSADLRTISADVRAGRGTLGGLLVDPSIYEDIKRLVGDLQRNEILRSLVRYSIREDQARDPNPEPRAESRAEGEPR